MPSAAQYGAAQPLLTNYSLAKMPDQGFIARQILPFVSVPDEDFEYLVWDDNTFVPSGSEAGEKAGSRQMHGTYTRVDGGFTTTAGRCDEFGFESLIDKRERSRGAVKGIDIRKSKSLIVRSQLLTAREKRASDLLFNTTTFTGVTAALAGSDRWDDANSDPIAQSIAAKKATRQAASAYFAGARWCLAIGDVVMDALRQNGAVIDRIQYTEGVTMGAVSDDQIARYLGVDELIVGKGIYNSSKDTGTGTLTGADLWGKYALFFWKAATPAKEIPSLGYTFGCEDYMVEEYADPQRRSDVVRGRELVVEKVCNAKAGYLFSTVVS